MEYPARIICDDMQFFADFAETFKKQDMVTAQGHVVYVSGGNRIAADRMEFNTRTRTGTFYNARGTTILGDQGESTDRSMFGGKEPDAYFWGETLTKLGPKKYKIENGGFTTCVQPTPRWEVVSGSVTINLDDYAFLTNSVFRVKGVPLMYLPIFYYPIQEDDRATGFLIPSYGSSTLKGQMLSNAFFWAIGRSHDATSITTGCPRPASSWEANTATCSAPAHRATAGSPGSTRTGSLTVQATSGPARAAIPSAAA
jgi:LPS-assembly protein